nr:DUF3330 domain-containing protein [Escherichia coli]
MQGNPARCRLHAGRAEYVEHFCGLECYQRFQARASTATETSVKPDACDSPPSG